MRYGDQSNVLTLFLVCTLFTLYINGAGECTKKEFY